MRKINYLLVVFVLFLLLIGSGLTAVSPLQAQQAPTTDQPTPIDNATSGFSAPNGGAPGRDAARGDLPVAETLFGDQSQRAPDTTNPACSGTGTYGGCWWFTGRDIYEDISGLSGAAALTISDDGVSTVNLPFAFNYYNTDYSQIHVHGNGFFSFGSSWSGATYRFAQSLPNASTPNNLIAAWWEDLNPAAGGTIHHKTFGQSPYRYIVFQFQDVPYYDSISNKVSFQLILYETTDHFQLIYNRADSDGDGNNAAVGYENSAGTAGRNAFYSTDNMTVPSTVIYLKPQSAAGEGCFARLESTGGVYGSNGNYFSDAVQAAVNAAATSDTIKLAGNCYGQLIGGGETAVIVNNKHITFEGGYTTSNWTTDNHAANPFIINGMDVHRHFILTNSNTIFYNQYLIRGNSAFTGNDDGGAIFVNSGSPQLALNSTLAFNRAGSSGGAVINFGNLTILNNALIQDNSAVKGGGVSNLGTLNISFGKIWSNKASDGGGVYNWSGGIINHDGQSSSFLANVQGNEATGNGGGFYNASGGTLNLRDSTYTNSNTAVNGGGVYNLGILNLQPGSGSLQEIKWNTATGNGGGIYSTGTINSSAASFNPLEILTNNAVNGGGIYLGGGSATLLDLTIGKSGPGNGNSATGNGAGIYSAISFNLTDSLVQRNSASSGDGGGLYQAGGTATISNSDIYNNSATNGGGVYNTSSGTVNLNSSTISDNNATNGGGIYNNGAGTTANLTNVELNSNDADYGGGIYNLGGTVDLDGGSIHHGTATYNGGGIRNTSSGSVDLDNGTAVYNNSAAIGGGLHSASGSVRLLWNNDFYNNTVTGDGGGIYNAGSLQIWNDSDIYNNNAPSGNGGGIYNGGHLYTQEITVHDNTAVSGAGIYHVGTSADFRVSSDLYSNTATSQGGGIYNAGSGTFYVRYSSKVRDNQAPNGGGIYNAGSTLTVDSSVDIDSNTATTGNGGGIYNTGTLEISGSSQIRDNVAASGNGGGVYSTGTAVVRNSTFSSNNAALGGGLATGNQLAIYNSYINGNSAAQGGGLNILNGTVTISQTHFYTNTALQFGGAIENYALLGLGTLSVYESTFEQNKAQYGGAIAHGGSTNPATIVNSTFTGNELHQSNPQGGAIFDSGPLTITLSTLTGNGLNASSGGGIYHQSTNYLYLNNTIVANSVAGGDCVDVNGFVVDNGHNLIEDGSCLSDPTGVTGDPALGPLADNGGGSTPNGTVPTHALTGGSPAINTGDCSGGTVAASQNGVTRLTAFPQFCDIGAFELEAVGTPLLDIGRAFRRAELTQNASLGTQAVNIPNNQIEKNFSDYDFGQLYDRYCVEFGQLQADLAAGLETDCTVWNGSNHPGGHPNLAAGGTRPVNVYNTLRNSVSIQQEQAFRNVLENPPLVSQSISNTMEAIREIHYIGLIYAHEFYADAIRYNIYVTATDNIADLNNEIALLEKAYTQYNIVANSMILLGERPLPANTIVSNLYTAEDLEMFALAATSEADVALEIAQRQQLIDPINNSEQAAGRLDAEYAKQQRYLTAFIGWLNTNYPEPTYNDAQRDAIFANNKGQGIAIGMEKMARLADDIRSSNNPFGYRDDYVPRVSYTSMDSKTGPVRDAAYAAEALVRDSARDYEETEAAMNAALFAIVQEFEGQLLALCGTEDFEGNCDAGAMAKNEAELIAAARAVDLAYQQVGNFSQLILIEQERAGAVAIELTSAAGDISLAQLQIGKLNSVQEVRTDFVTDQDSTRTGHREEAKVTNRTTITADSSPNPLTNGSGVKNETEIEASVSAWTETESETTTGTTTETVVNPNLELIAGYEARQLLREYESAATIEGANSAAEIRRLLLEQSDALIMLDIAAAEFNAVLAEHNLLIAQWEDLKLDYSATITNAQYYFDRPSHRLIYDQLSADYNEKFSRLQNYAFLTAKALEYEFLDDGTIDYNALYRARRVADIDLFLAALADAYLATYGNDNSNIRLNTVSLVEEVAGLSTAYVTSLINQNNGVYVVDSLADGWPQDPACAGPTFNITQIDTLTNCLFQEYLIAHTAVVTVNVGLGITNDIIQIPFSTRIKDVYGFEPGLGTYNRWNARITSKGSGAEGVPCTIGIPCRGVWIDILTDQYPSGFDEEDTPAVILTYSGMGIYAKYNGDIVRYRPGPPRLIGQEIPGGFATAWSIRQELNADINGVDHDGLIEQNTSGGLQRLSPVNNGWFLEINLDDDANNELDLSQISDIEVNVEYVYRTTQITSSVATRMNEAGAAVNRGEMASADLEAEYEAALADLQANQFTAEEKAQLARIFAAMAPGAITETTYIDPLVPHGTYQGNMLAFGFTEVGVMITATDVTSVSQQITGTLCITCSVVYTAVPLTGAFTNTGTPTNTFILTSAPQPMIVDGSLMGTVQLTKTYRLEGIVLENGNIISGTYTEVVTDSKGIAATIYVGYFTMSRWSRTPGAVTPTLDITVGPGGFPSISWTSAAENCSYQLYHSGLPYFVNYPRQMVARTESTTFIDTVAATVNQPIFYRLRALSCGTNLDYLEEGATYYRDSATLGVFSFAIAPGE